MDHLLPLLLRLLFVGAWGICCFPLFVPLSSCSAATASVSSESPPTRLLLFESPSTRLLLIGLPWSVGIADDDGCPLLTFEVLRGWDTLPLGRLTTPVSSESPPARLLLFSILLIGLPWSPLLTFEVLQGRDALPLGRLTLTMARPNRSCDVNHWFQFLILCWCHLETILLPKLRAKVELVVIYIHPWHSEDKE